MAKDRTRKPILTRQREQSKRVGKDSASIMARMRDIRNASGLKPETKRELLEFLEFVRHLIKSEALTEGEAINKALKSPKGIQCFGRDSLTLAEISMILGVTRERVRQIETVAIKKLKHPTSGRHLKQYILD